MNKIFWCCLFLLGFSSCQVVPFFIPKENLAKREKERNERLGKKKEKTQDKIQRKKIDNKETSNRTIKKLDKIENKLPHDTATAGLNAETFIKEKEKVENVQVALPERVMAVSMMTANRVDYNGIRLKTKMEYQSGNKRQKFNALFRINKDKEIWVSVTAVNIEVARAYITPDSVLAMDRINKKYYRFSYQDIIKLINIDISFKDLQDIIVGNAVGKDGDVFEFSDFGGTVGIGLKNDDYLNKLTYNKSDSTLRQIQLQLLRGQFASNILGMMSEYEKENGQLFSKKRLFNIEDSRGKLSLELEVMKVEFSDVESVPFSIPPNYSPADVKD